MFKKGFAALVCLIMLPALSSWGATTYQLQTKLANAGGTIQVRNSAPQTAVGAVVFTNLTTSAPVAVRVAAAAGYKISSVTKSGVAQTITDPASFSASFLKSAGTAQTLVASFATQQLTVTGSAAGPGTVSPASASVPYGGSAVFLALPSTVNSYLTGVSGGSVTDSAGNPVTFPYAGTARITLSNVTASQSFTASFVTAGSNAGVSQVAALNSPVALSGTLSGGGSATWVQVGGPAVTLTGASTLTPSFTATSTGTYVFQLIQVLGGRQVSSATTQVTVVGSLSDNMKSSCMGCHGSGGALPTPEVFGQWSTSSHKGAGISCVSCHSNGAMPTPVNTASVSAATLVVLSASAGTPGSYYCVKCHNPGIATDYDASPHKAHGVACIACHTQGVHNPDPGATVCNGCHLDASGSVPRHPFALNGNPCTTCHNPHSTAGTLATPSDAHYNNVTSAGYPASYVTSRASCENCHVDNAQNAAIRQQWAASGHANTTDTPFVDYDFKTRAGCVQCHTTTGFIAFSSAKVSAAWGVASDKTKEVITCVACHSDVAAGAVRTVTPVKPFADERGYQNRNVGTSNICMDCHSGRNNGASIQVQVGTGDFTTLGFIAPHYLSAGGTLHGKSGYLFPGRSYAGYSSNSHRSVGMTNTMATGTDGPCVTCHMTSASSHGYQPVSVDQSGTITAISTTVCANCHNTAMPAATLEADRVAFKNALAILNAQLAAVGHTYSPNYPYFAPGNWGTGQAGANVMGAAFNYKLFLAEPGAYAHNASYAKQLVIDSIDAAANGGTVTGDISSALAALVASGAITQDQADGLSSYKSSSSCATCHSNSSGSHGKHLADGIGCAQCHSLTAASNGALVPGTSRHLNGVTDVSLAAGGSYAAATRTCSTVYCHSNGANSYANPLWGASSNCSFCHPIASLRGAHAAHVGSVIPTAYGDTANGSTAGEYRFGCGSCHPTDLGSHGNGFIEVTLVPTADGSLRSLNSPSALVGGIGNTGSGIAGNSGTSVVCSAAYCHSNGGVGSAFAFVASPDWYGGAYGGDRCAMCHGNAPATGAHAKHATSIHTGQITGADGLLTLGHGDTVPATVIGCNLCHAATVGNDANDLGSACASCHAGNAKGTPLLDRTAHLNGRVDVVFKDVQILTKAQVRPAGFSSYSGIWARTSYKTDANSYDLAKRSLNQAVFAADKSCANVACHNGAKPTWSDKLTCVNCHSRL